MTTTQDAFTLIAAGPLDAPGTHHDLVRPILQSGDITFGTLVIPLSNRGKTQLFGGYTTLGGREPKDTQRGARQLADDGFDVLSFSVNHALDRSEDSLFDTLDALAEANIPVIGAGRNIDEARAPAVVEVNGTRVGFLAYCSVAQRNFEATANRPGITPLRAHTYYEQTDWQPGTPPRIVTDLYPEDQAAMVADIEALRPNVDVLVVALHKGIHFQPGTIATYEFQASHAAIDAGADLILGAHAGILKAVEIYAGKPILHCIGQFDIGPKGPRGEFYDGTREFESQKATIVKCTIANGRIERVALLPCWLAGHQPEPLTGSDPRFDSFIPYLEWATEFVGLETKFVRDGDEIVVLT